jgi:Helix-turn-helix domain
LLRNPETKIIHVAEECGFNHLGLFNTCFKRRFGVSPGEWRKQARLQEDTPPSGTKPLCSLESKGLCPLAIAAKSLAPKGSQPPPGSKLPATKPGAKVLPIMLYAGV